MMIKSCYIWMLKLCILCIVHLVEVNSIGLHHAIMLKIHDMH